MQPGRTPSHDLRRALTIALVAPLLACASSSGEVMVATPPGELPALILPEGLLSDGTRPAKRHDTSDRSEVRPREPAAPAKASPQAAGSLVPASPLPTSYALVIGIEDYRDVPAATGARLDAESFAAVIETTLGAPSEHVRVLLDERASRSDINKEMRWLAANVPAGGRVCFYDSGPA